MAQQYISVNGLTTIKEAVGVRKAFEDARYFSACPSTSHRPMTGFLVSDGTARGEGGNARYPEINKLKKMMMHSASFGPCIHYCTLDKYKISSRILDLFQRLDGATFIKALQLNVYSPSPGEVAKIKMKYPQIEIILPVTGKTISKPGVKDIARIMYGYRSVADHILIDTSEGKGVELATNYAAQIYNALRETLPDLRYGFAGGFTAENVARKTKELTAIIKTDEYSIDVESGVREDDRLSISKVREFLVNAHQVFP